MGNATNIQRNLKNLKISRFYFQNSILYCFKNILKISLGSKTKASFPFKFLSDIFFCETKKLLKLLAIRALFLDKISFRLELPAQVYQSENTPKRIRRYRTRVELRGVLQMAIWKWFNDRGQLEQTTPAGVWKIFRA